jgi:hypothetical protein
MKSIPALVLAFLCIAMQAEAKPPAAIDKVRFYPAPGHEQAIVGGKFYGSNASKDSGFVLLAEIKDVPPANQWTELSIPNTTPYRWIKYEAPAGSFGYIVKLEFYAGDERLLGEYFGSFPGWWNRVINNKPLDPKAISRGETADGNYFGFDIRDRATGPWPFFQPGQGEYKSPITVTLKSAPADAVIRYTTDGTEPTVDNGQTYTGPIPVDKTTTISAAAFVKGVAPSPVAIQTYVIGSLIHRVSFDVGNSLTGITGRYPAQAYTAGYDQVMDKFLLGGGLTKALWNCAFTPIGDPSNRDQWIQLYTTTLGDTNMYSKEEIERTTQEWNTLWPKTTQIDDFTLQPRDFDIAEEADFDNRFLNLVMQKAPDARPWLYVEWDEKPRRRPTDQAKVPTSEMKKLYPLMTWEESMGGMMLYGEDLKRKIEETYKGGKPIQVIPAALAMGWIHHMIENGEVPGIAKDQFYPKLFSDQVHTNADGSYLVDCTWFAALTGKSPEGTFLPVLTGLTSAQAQVMQRLAWDCVKNYPYSGYYEEGTTPCAKPEISALPAGGIQDKAPVSLTSATPGVWFRYTLDGTPPGRTNGYIYCGVITVRPGMTLKAIAYKSGMADSEVAETDYPAATAK